ncbi:MAG: hypothetical protein R2698_03625 [Microthrixaceae bacterium]
MSPAYDVIGDEERRREYDEVRSMGPLGSRMGGAGFGRNPGGGPFAGADIGDLLSNLFGRGPPRVEGGRAPAARLRAPDPNVAPISRPTSTCRSSMRPTASPPRSTSRAT